MKRVDLTGCTFGLLTVLGVSGKKHGKTAWRCKCQCGKYVDVISHALLSGSRQSCGCTNASRNDLTGKKFGKLSVLGDSGKRSCKKILWECLCDCGNRTLACGQDLIQGKKTSCGCVHRQRLIDRNKANAIHNETKTRLHHVWAGIKMRCFNPNTPSYKYYGMRGITMCDEWKNSYTSFRDWALANGYADNLSIERVDVNGDYCPENCIWIPAKDQSRNRRNTVRCGGVALSVLAVLYEVPYDLLYNRFRFLNWPIEEALGLVDHVYDEDRCKESLYYKNRRWKRGCKQ